MELNYNYFQLNANYAHRINLEGGWFFRPAIEVGIGSKSNLFKNLTLGDQININTGNITLLDPDSFFFYNPSTFYAPGKDKDIDSMRYFEVRLKFQNFTTEIFNSYFTNSKNWSRHRELVEERNIA